MRKVRDLLADGPVLETKVRRELMRDYEHGRALRHYQQNLLTNRRYERRIRGCGDVDGYPKEIPDPQKAADAGRRSLAIKRIKMCIQRGQVIREVGPDGLVYLRWIAT